MDWIPSLDNWAQAVVFAIVLTIIFVVYRIVTSALKKGVKYKGMEVGGSGYLTGAQTVQLIHKNNHVIEEKFSIIYGKKRCEQMEYVEQKNDYIRDIMMRHYKKILDGKDINPFIRQGLIKTHKMLTRVMLDEQKSICRTYFKSINGSLKEGGIEDLNNPKSEVNEEILQQADWMIRKGSEIITDWFIETAEVTRDELYKMNLEIVEEIKCNIVDALRRGHKIHKEYEDKIEVLEKDIDRYANTLLQGGKIG